MIEKAPLSAHMLTYDQALLYCQFLDHNGHRDWRMPKYIEFDTHYDIIGWYEEKPHTRSTFDTWFVLPVRDI